MSGGPRLAVRSGARALAAAVVARVVDDGAWAQPALASALSSSSLDARDKALCTELTYGTLRWSASLEQSLLRAADKPGRGLDKRIRPHLLVAAYQLQHMAPAGEGAAGIPARAAVHEAVNAVRAVRPGLEGFANALLRRLGLPPHETLPPNAPVADVADALGVPAMLAEAVAALVPPEEVRAALLGLNARPSTYAAVVARGRAGFDGSAGASPEAGRAHAFVPNVVALGGGAVVDARGFEEGAFVVMDPGSAVAALLVAPQDGARVLDLCAAPGAKATVLAALGARVTAVDQSDKRAKRIRENAARTKLPLEVIVGDARAPIPGVGDGAFDAVLLDAPCSGFGTTRRKPEIKLRRTAADVAADAALQRELLEAAAARTAPGGVLVYSVCSPLPAEGVDVVEPFLARHADFSVEPARAVLPWLPEDAVDARGFVHLLPHRHDADAFFCARLRRA